ncbi:hypothetical protein [Prosthecobacter sp.]|jgi:hypothetical protein|uniref:hypothetical protein n=1 Tax=Prosthecobacter sp. TaxID=1965333 RepID=UPI0037C853A2
MKLLRETSLILRNTLFVTVAVILGFTLGSALGVPVYLQGFCLLPAALLFNRLSGGGPFAWWKVLGFLIVLSSITFVFAAAFPHLPPSYRSWGIVVFVMLAPVSSVTKWLERRFGRTAPAAADSRSKSS